MASFTQDVGYAIRSLTLRPAFTAVVLITLALGIGSSTLVFSVVDGILLSPLPYEEPDRLVRIYQMWPRAPRELGWLGGAPFREYRALDDLFDGVGALYTYSQDGADIMVDGEPERILVMPISAGTFEVLGVQPLVGREFEREEEAADAGIAVISHGLWQRFFGGDADVIGRSFELDGESHTVVGVMPAEYRNPIGPQVDAWVPLHLLPVAEGDDPNDWDNHYLSAIGRLRPGVSVAQAHARLDSLVPTFEERYEDVNGQTARLVPLLEDKVSHTATMLWVLMGSAGMVLLIACVNVANLYLVRSADRSKELAIRAALGAGRVRLVLQMLSESLLLGLLGGIAGLLLSFAGLRALVAMSPGNLPRIEELGIDLRVFAFATAVSVLTGLLFGMVPALRFSRPGLERSLRQDNGRVSGSRSVRQMRGALVVAEVALALILMFGAGLLTRSFVNLLAVDHGIRPGGVLTYEVHLPTARYPEGAQRVAFYDEVFGRVGGIPGVEAVGAVSFLPTEGEYHQWGLRRLDIDPESDAARSGPNVRTIDGDYLEVMGISIERGRRFGPGDIAESPKVMLINEVVAEQLFPDRDPIGAPVRLSGTPYEVVGVVSSSARDPFGNVGPDVYIAHDQYADNRNWSMKQTVRVAGDPLAVVGQIRTTLREVDPSLVVHRVRTMSGVVDAGISPQRFAMALMTAFAGVAILLAAVGIYGVLAYTVAQRTREIGIRMALGADGAKVRVMVLREALSLSAVGVVLGIAGALALSGWLTSLLFEVQPTDPWMLAAVAAGVVVLASVAGYLPARRATKVDPVLALRSE
jgi:putative ABC transport system permease protein